MRLLLAVLLAVLFAAPAAAQAAVLAYVDGGEVWASTLDGTRKERLSSGEGDFIAVAAADTGRILGVRLEAGKIFQLARIQLWDERGQVISQGPLPYDSGTSWSSYVAPLGLDLTADATFLLYGYSGQVGIVPNATFPKGFDAILSDTKTGITPIGQSGYFYPSAFGRQVIAQQGSSVVVQRADAGNPFATTWDPIVDTSSTGYTLHRTDVAATGTLAALELTKDAADDRIGVLSLSGVVAPVTVGQPVDCFLPTSGEAGEPSLSPDGTTIAWKDAQGVRVAGVPTTSADPCVLSSAPLVISPTGKSPAIGGGDLATLRPPPASPGLTGAPAPAAPAAPAGSLGVTLPARVTLKSLATSAGLAIGVRVPAAGRVTVSGTVSPARLGLKGRKPVVVLSGSATAKAAGTLRMRVKLNAKGKRYRKRLRGATVLLRITQGGRTTTRRVTLR